MHELGHLVMHRHGGPAGRIAEQQADSFASAMLMPRDDVLAYAPRFISFSVLLQLKKRWIVSMAALNYRLHALGLNSDWHYRTLCIQISEKGLRMNELEPCAHESSQLLHKVFAELRKEGITRSDIAEDLHIRTEDLDALVFGLVLAGINGGRKGNAGTPGVRRHLSIVTNDE
jgi:Zn-dependent peptidase ImmA (M78 family)